MDDESRRKFGTGIHITAIDGIVNVNSLFTLAVFIGLTWNPSDANNSLITGDDNPNCVAGSNIAENLISFHVYSFSSFLFSSLIALGLKQAIRIAKNTEAHNLMMARVNKTLLRVGILISAVGSVCGCGFLMLALVNVVQIKLGTLACGSSYSFAAIVPLVILVPAALLIYLILGWYLNISASIVIERFLEMNEFGLLMDYLGFDLMSSVPLIDCRTVSTIVKGLGGCNSNNRDCWNVGQQRGEAWIAYGCREWLGQPVVDLGKQENTCGSKVWDGNGVRQSKGDLGMAVTVKRRGCSLQG
ncbi:hypothetical protein HHK36_011097 [Tetracentron sinense]|uniref:Maternal effect embryo arrest 60 n=1 Tax=Tetracentron sinense TaxID=13715 RepID=A0A835DGW6_TETSI|nr:hypothetical protein HHK36_011097 [Tetracentron sinense]